MSSPVARLIGATASAWLRGVTTKIRESPFTPRSTPATPSASGSQVRRHRLSEALASNVRDQSTTSPTTASTVIGTKSPSRPRMK